MSGDVLGRIWPLWLEHTHSNRPWQSLFRGFAFFLQGRGRRHGGEGREGIVYLTEAAHGRFTAGKEKDAELLTSRQILDDFLL